jgi:hypothetical protein
MPRLWQKLTLSEPVGAVALLLVGIVCASVLLLEPRAVAPLELPSLSLPRAPTEAVIAADAQAARGVPNNAHAAELEALFSKHGAAESRGFEDVDSYSDRRKSLELAFRSLVAEVGEVRALCLRAKAVEQLEAALELRLPDAQAKAVLGAFTNVLAREGLSRDGYLVAPRFVVRTLYKARWNILHGLAPDHAFATIEKRAFYGWQALHAESAPVKRRIEALHAYGLAGGEHVEEALGALLFRLGDYRQSAKALQIAYDKQGSLRLRNYMLAARDAARASPPSD